MLLQRSSGFVPYSGDGIDVEFKAADTTWTVDVALRHNSEHRVLLAECRRRVARPKQEDLAGFAYKVERIRQLLGLPVAGVFVSKRPAQIGGIRVADFNGIDVAELDETDPGEGFSVAFHRYDQGRDKRLRHFVMKAGTGSYAATGNEAHLSLGRADAEEDSDG